MSGWKAARVGDICKAANGRAFKPTEWNTEGAPIIRIQNLKNDSAPFNYFRGEIEPRFRVQYGDLLFAWSGTPGTSFGAHIWRGGDAVLNQHIFNLHFDRKKIDERFFCYALNRNVADYVAKAQGGVGLAHITKGKFEDSLVPLPDIVEQRAVVAELEKQFSRLDEAVAGLKRVKANIKRYRASVLDAFFADDPNVCLGDVIESGPQNGLYLPKSAYGAGTPMLRIDDYQTNWIRPVGELRRVTATDAKVATWALREGDLVVNRVNSMSHLGKCASIPVSLAGALFESNMMRFALKSHALPRYVELYLGGLRGRRRLTQRAKWAVNQASINQQDLLATPLPLPNIDRQRVIVAEVDRLLSIAREAEAEVETNLKRAQGLRQAILSKAFTGDVQ